MKLLRLLSYLVVGLSLLSSDFVHAQTTVTIGAGTSSSSTRGPFQRADTNSSTVFSRWVQVYTSTELAAAGITNGVDISQLAWDMVSDGSVFIGSGSAYLKIYIKNSTATSATSDTWSNLITGSTQVFNDSFNTTNNFPSSNGWFAFPFSSPFNYTGGAIEIAVDWDCSQVSTPALSGNGAVKFRWESTSPDDLVVKRTASSSAPTSISDLKDERANIQITYLPAGCAGPTNLNAGARTATTADLNWTASTGATNYTWKVVAAGAGSSAAAVDNGTTANTMVTATGLMPLTSYDLFVESDCGMGSTSGFEGPYTFLTAPTTLTLDTIGLGTSSSSTRGPFQRSDTNSSTLYSRFVHIYTAGELAAAGIVTGSEITNLSWELASSNVVIGSGNATLKVYIKNSTATAAVAGNWPTMITGSDLVVDNSYNTTNNFPGANGWMPFYFSAPFVYTGGALEIAVDWDCSQVSTPAFSGDGSLKWRWASTAPDDLVVKKTSSSGASNNISDVKNERANIRFAYNSPVCDMPGTLNATNITTSSADLSWTGASADSSMWKIVLAGAGVNGTAVDAGTTSGLAATTTMLAAQTSYDLYVEADCGAIGTSGYSGPYTFRTLCAAVPLTATSFMVTPILCNGDSTGAIDMTVTAGVPSYAFRWSTSDTTEDISGLTAGMYTVEITDADGCPYLDTVMISEPTAIMVTTTTVADTSGAGLGSASITAAGGTAPYTYTWDGSAGSADSTGLAAGSYPVTVTDANGCTDTMTIVIDNFITSIDDLDYITTLSIAPNPTSGVANIELVLSQHAAIDLSVYSSTGKLIESVSLENSNELNHKVDLSSYANGIYFVRVAINDETISKRILLNK